MSIIKSADDIYAPGGTINYLISYENTGLHTAYNVVITDTFPSEWFTSISSFPGWSSKDGDVYTWNLGDIAPGEEGIIEITAITSSSYGGTISNIATLDYEDALGYPRPSETSETSTVVHPDYCNVRTIGFWKHQVNSLMKGKGHPHYTTEQMNHFATAISGEATALGEFDSYVDMLDYLETPKGKDFKNPTLMMEARAKQQYMALWLNIVSYRTSLGTEIMLTDTLGNLKDGDFWIDGTVNDAIDIIEVILNDPEATFEDYDKAKTIACSLNEGYGKGLRETVDVDAQGQVAQSSFNLKSGVKYRLKVTGTAYAGDTIDFDAKYSITNRIYGDTWTDSVSGYESYGPKLLDLLVDGDVVNWGVYSPDHTYYWTLTGDGTPLDLQIYDIYYPNNIGYLTVEIWELP
jgi:uncharacterized repeat protein (TIGR01451 family)